MHPHFARQAPPARDPVGIADQQQAQQHFGIDRRSPGRDVRVLQPLTKPYPLQPRGCSPVGILVVNAYHEMREFDAMLQGMNGALKPGGSLAIIDAQDEPGQPRSAYQERHTLLAEIVCEDAARHGLRFQRELPGFSNPESKRKYYFLIFERPKRI